MSFGDSEAVFRRDEAVKSLTDEGIRTFFSSSLAVNALWHGPERDISKVKSST